MCCLFTVASERQGDILYAVYHQKKLSSDSGEDLWPFQLLIVHVFPRFCHFQCLLAICYFHSMCVLHMLIDHLFVLYTLCIRHGIYMLHNVANVLNEKKHTQLHQVKGIAEKARETILGVSQKHMTWHWESIMQTCLVLCGTL